MIPEQIQTSAERIGSENFIFKQDNPKLQIANITKRYFSFQKIKLLDCLALSTDLNVIENCWGELTYLLYRGGRQFNNTEELKIAIIRKWKNLPQTYIQNLFNSLSDRMLAVID